MTSHGGTSPGQTAAPIDRGLSITATRVSGPACPQRFNIARDIIGKAARATPGKPALIVANGGDEQSPLRRLTYGEIEAAVMALAGQLRACGLQEGERVLIRMANTPDYAFAVFACFAAGVIAVPTSDQLTNRELETVINDARPRAVMFDAASACPALNAIEIRFGPDATETPSPAHDTSLDYADTAADDPALLIYTSGTTSRPKGVLHAHRFAWGRRPMVHGWYGLTTDDRLLHAGAFNWTFTLGTGLIDPWMAGATSIINIGDRRPEIWPALLRRTEATLFAAVPGLFRQILKYNDLKPGDLPRLRHGLIAGDAPPHRLFEDWRAATGTELYEALGQSEISTYISSSPALPRKEGAIGKPQDGRAVAILPEDSDSIVPVSRGDVGCLAVHASDPGLMLGYWERPEEQAEVFRGDWFVGGDRAAMDAEGYITHHGRADDVMKPLGYRVSPPEVELAIASHPGIAEAACKEVEVKDGVRVIAAFVVATDADAPPSEDELHRHAAERLAAYKRPRLYRLIDHLPKTANGKLVRAKLVFES